MEKYTIKQVMEILGKSRPTVYAKMKELSFYDNLQLFLKKGNNTYITLEGLEVLKNAFEVGKEEVKQEQQENKDTNILEIQYLKKIVEQQERQINSLEEDKKQLNQQVEKLTNIIGLKQQEETREKEILLLQENSKKPSFWDWFKKKKSVPSGAEEVKEDI